jgi:hypothetical protein
LHGVKGISIIAGQPSTDGVDPCLVLSQQIIKGASIAVVSRSDEPLVFGVRRDGSMLLGSCYSGT